MHPACICQGVALYHSFPKQQIFLPTCWMQHFWKIIIKCHPLTNTCWMLHFRKIMIKCCNLTNTLRDRSRSTCSSCNARKEKHFLLFCHQSGFVLRVYKIIAMVQTIQKNNLLLVKCCWEIKLCLVLYGCSTPGFAYLYQGKMENFSNCIQQVPWTCGAFLHSV